MMLRFITLTGYIGTLCILSALHNWTGLIGSLVTPLFVLMMKTDRERERFLKEEE